ncbi:Six-hairpin glycosidase [Amylostereum chailletii]|nr:Six-hairpin glycosidase [Amylostereum chailletii]
MSWPIALLALSSLPQVLSITYSTYAADSGIARGQGNGLSAGAPTVSYEHGEFQWALRLLFERTGNRTYFDYIKAGVDNIVDANGHVGANYVWVALRLRASLDEYQLDPLRVGPSFLYLYDETGDERYKKAADQFRAQLETHPRTTEGQFWHKAIYPNQGWLDGIYMGDVFYATYTAAFQPTNRSAWDDIALQFDRQFNHTLQLASTALPTETLVHLLYHGYDNAHVQDWASPDRGHSPEIWDRALGWYAMALVDVLALVPATPPTAALRATLAPQLAALLPALAQAADPASGAWWLVLTQPARAGNYFESSGGAMFVYALLKAVRLGLVHDADGALVAAAKNAYAHATRTWVLPNADGTMDWNATVVVGSLQPGNDYEYYVSQAIDLNDLKGLAAFVLASIEFEQL